MRCSFQKRYCCSHIPRYLSTWIHPLVPAFLPTPLLPSNKRLQPNPIRTCSLPRDSNHRTCFPARRDFGFKDRSLQMEHCLRMVLHHSRYRPPHSFGRSYHHANLDWNQRHSRVWNRNALFRNGVLDSSRCYSIWPGLGVCDSDVHILSLAWRGMSFSICPRICSVC